MDRYKERKLRNNAEHSEKNSMEKKITGMDYLGLGCLLSADSAWKLSMLI